MVVKKSIEPEFPSKDAIHLYGALSFLYFRSPRHRDWPFHAIRRVIQPPIDLQQVKIFYQDGIPRGAVTWGLLNEDAERRVMANQMLEPAQWRSGKSFWLMDVLA
ncbi:toxin-activating lysine-acyltransferase, partial [Methylobrevis albus]